MKKREKNEINDGNGRRTERNKKQLVNVASMDVC
jgi:hypothetical protein